jgi:FixJ family two-component response regulator
MTTRGRVLLVDDEAELRLALERLLRIEGYEVQAFDSADALLAAAPQELGDCLLLDVAMPGLDGLALQRRLAELAVPLPIVFVTGHGDIPMSVQAVKSGAVDFLTKPVRREALLRAIEAALQLARRQRAASDATAALRARFAQLTPREREVMQHVITGRLNKVIAGDLGTSEQTIKVHRGRVLEKLGANSVAELVRIAQQLGIEPAT